MAIQRFQQIAFWLVQKILNFPVPLTQQYLFCQAKGQPIRRALEIGLVSVRPVRSKCFLFAYSN